MRNKQISQVRGLQINDTDDPAAGGGAQPPLRKWAEHGPSFQRGCGGAQVDLIVENWTSTASARWSSSPPPARIMLTAKTLVSGNEDGASSRGSPPRNMLL